MSEISSPQNDRVKYIVRLKNDKRQRHRDGVMLVEGSYELELALKSGCQVVDIYFCNELAIQKRIPGLLNAPIQVSRSAFEKMSHREGPDGWLGVFGLPITDLNAIELTDPALLILVEAIEKPGNLGAIFRTADAVGADGVIICDPRTDVYGPNVIRASRGTIFTVKNIVLDNQEALAYLHKNKINLLAATPKAELIYSDMDLHTPVCIAVGAEDVGLSEFWMDQADMMVKIPMMGEVNSLNVSTSTAIILYEILRQRNSGRK